MELTPLERAILNWIASRTGDPTLAHQLSVSVPCKREFTDCGSFTELRTSFAATPLTYTLNIIEPGVEGPQLEHGAGCVLHLRNGFVSCLEIYTNSGEALPHDVDSWTLL